MKVVHQIIIYFAATGRHLTGIPIEKIRRFESEFLDYLDTGYSELILEIEKLKELTPEIQEKLVEAINSFKGKFE